MPIPDYQDCMLPLLEALAGGKDYQLRAVTTALADRFGLSQDERQELLPSKSQTVIANRVAWANASFPSGRTFHGLNVWVVGRPTYARGYVWDGTAMENISNFDGPALIGATGEPREFEASFETGPVRLTTRLIEGEFPNYRQLLPAAYPNRLSVDKETLLDAVRRVKLLVKDATTPVRVALPAPLFAERMVAARHHGDAVVQAR